MQHLTAQITAVRGASAAFKQSSLHVIWADYCEVQLQQQLSPHMAFKQIMAVYLAGTAALRAKCTVNWMWVRYNLMSTLWLTEAEEQT